MNKNMLIREIIENLYEDYGVGIESLVLKDVDNDDNVKEIECIIITCNYHDFDNNVAYMIRHAIKKIAKKYDIYFNAIYLDL